MQQFHPPQLRKPASHPVLSAHQFGFRKQMSTRDEIIQLTEFIYDSLDGKNSCLNVFIYSRAFDTVNHNILLNKLNRYMGYKAMHYYF